MSVDQNTKIEDNVKRGKVFAMPAQLDNTLRKYTDERYRPSLSKTKDQDNFRLVPTNESNLGLWEQAWEQVKAQEEDWEHWPQFCGVKDLKTKDVVTEVHSFARRRCDEAEKHQGHVFGTSLTYRRLCSKVATCAKKFEVVGDLVVQAEPVYAALPWVTTSALKHSLSLVDVHGQRLLLGSSLRYVRLTGFRKRYAKQM